MSAAIQEKPPQEPKAPADDKGAALIAKRFPEGDGWKNANVGGHSWRCNRWVLQGYSGFVAESHFVTATPNGLVVHDEPAIRSRVGD